MDYEHVRMLGVVLLHVTHRKHEQSMELRKRQSK